MMEGKIHLAFRYLLDNASGGVLDIEDHVGDQRSQTVLDVLKDKHPAARSVYIEPYNKK